MKKHKIQIVYNISNERLEFINNMMDEMSMNKSKLVSLGIKKMLEIKKEIIGRIALGDYKKAIKSKINNVFKPYTNREYKTFDHVYVYHIEKISKSVLLVFYKLNNDTSDYIFTTARINRRRVDESIIEHFPLDLWESVPGE